MKRGPREILGRWFLIPGQRRASRLVPANNSRQRMEELRLRDPQLFSNCPPSGDRIGAGGGAFYEKELDV